MGISRSPLGNGTCYGKTDVRCMLAVEYNKWTLYIHLLQRLLQLNKRAVCLLFIFVYVGLPWITTITLFLVLNRLSLCIFSTICHYKTNVLHGADRYDDVL